MNEGASIRTADVDSAATFRLVRGVLLLLFSYVFLANSWVGDDSYITFRVIWNFIHGYGLTFNPDERVQAYTHPLWMLVMSAAYAVTREFFFTSTGVSWAFCLATLAVLIRWAGSAPRATLLVVWLLSSKAFVDYTSSGLEYPLSYLLLALFYSRYLNQPSGIPVPPRELRWLMLVASLAFVNRPDAIFLYVVPIGEMVVRSLRHRDRPARNATDVVGAVAVGLAPAVVWVAFAMFYYGFPLPNTYYAKVGTGIPRALMIRQGFAYLFNSVSWDPVTIGTIVLAVLWTLSTFPTGRTNAPARGAAVSTVLSVVYTVAIGGDFMSGRFFAMPFLVATMAVLSGAAGVTVVRPAWIGGALLLYNLLVPLAPIKTTARYEAAWPWRTQNGIKDERGNFHQNTNVLFFSPFREIPDTIWQREALSFRNGPDKVAVLGSIGFWGLYAGPDKFLIDRNALSDPLLARLPVSPRLYFEFYASHYFRDIPEGYVESCDQNMNLLTDPLLHDYYERLRNVTRGSLVAWSRFADIWELNVGKYSDLHLLYETDRPIQLSIRADNERFLTDVGDRDERANEIRATGRRGYLQYGPRVPMKAGIYRARWMGLVDAPVGTPIGFVEVWNGPDKRIAREEVLAIGPNQTRRIAHIDFTLLQDADALEYRFFVQPNVEVTLERVELYSANAIPIEP